MKAASLALGGPRSRSSMRSVVQTIGLVLGGALIFAAGLAAGRAVRPESTPPPVAGLNALQQRTVPILPAARSADATRSAANGAGDVTTETAPVSQQAMARLQRLVELNRKLSSKLKFTVMEPFSLKLNEDFVRAFDVTPGERRTLEAMLEKTRADLDRAELAQARIEPQADGTFTISIAAFPQEGGRILDRLVEDFGNTMGPQRADFLREMNLLGEEGFSFDGFGTRTTKVQLQPASSASANSWSIHLDEATGAYNEEGRMNLARFREKFPLVYEKMRAEGRLPATPGP